MLRDIALQSGGLLVNKIGGPSVKPYQPPNVWEQVSYPTSDTVHLRAGAWATRSIAAACTPTGSAWRRRPNMDAFDAPMRDVVCTRRQRTDTPLQALVTMNDVQWVEAARALAERVIQEGGPQAGEAHRPDERDSACRTIPRRKMAAVLENVAEADGEALRVPIQKRRTRWLHVGERSATRRFRRRNWPHGRWWPAKC